MVATNKGLRLKQLVFRLHQQCVGLSIQGVSPLRYLNVLLQHLLSVSRSSSTSRSLRQRSRILLLSLACTSVAAVLGVGYGGTQLVLKLRSMLKTRRQGTTTNLRRTRSQMLLASGARIIYVPEDNKKFTDNKRKKIFIPPKDDDIYDHDKFLFKNIELDRNKNNQLFYSKFLNQLSVLSRILIPNLLHKNSFLFCAQISFLIMRTWLSLFVARLDGQIVKDIIARRGRRFLWDLGSWFLIALPASYTNSAIKLLQRKLSLNFRVNLTRYIHDIYLDKQLVFYKLIFDSKASNSVIKNIDNSITNDITKFCDSTCSIFANIAKPIIDLVFFSVYLRDNLGTFGITGIFINYFITGYILKSFTPPLGKLASSKSSAEGDYYNYHLNMINNSEEIAFYQGTQVEKTKVQELYRSWMDRSLAVDKNKFNYNMIEDYILKYTWSGLGYVFASIPIIMTTVVSGTNSEEINMKEFIVNKRLMLSLADAGSRLMHSIKDISQLTGYTNRIFTLLSVLLRVHSNTFNYGADTIMIAKMVASSTKTIKAGTNNNESIQGTIQHNFNGVRLENIDVIIPSGRAQEGTKLIKKLTFQIPPSIDPATSSSKPGSIRDLDDLYGSSLPFFQGPSSSLLILGSNSCGKSSIQRIIANIWPIYNKNGLLSIPSEENLFCLPQKSYFVRGGTFRDQIIYPMSSDEFFDRGLKDKILVQILTEVSLEYLLKRRKGWSYLDEVADWKDVFSGGEKQRVNFARILFHRPRFLVLDEATNAISVDMEDHMFNLLKKYRFNFITISQRPSLIKYHDLLLEIEGQNGSWNLQTLGTDDIITTIDNEIEELETKLDNVHKLKAERQELQAKLAQI